MGILNNFSNQNLGAYCLVGGGAAALTLGNTFRPWHWRNFTLQTGADEMLDTAGKPTGQYGETSWGLPILAGEMSMGLTGTGSLTASLIPSIAMAVDFTGTSTFNATAGLVVSMLCNMTGTGTLTATIVGNLNMLAAITGVGGLTAGLQGLGNIGVALTGTGDLDAAIAAFGDMSVDIVVTGTGLSNEGVAQAVWAELLEGALSAEDIMRLLLAVAAGKSDGGAGTTIHFRDQADTKNRVTATVDTNGNRSAVTPDPS